jgi:hypothetical protein
VRIGVFAYNFKHWKTQQGIQNLILAGFKPELGLRGPEQGHYPNVVYNQPIYKKLGINGNCPIAENIANKIKNNS